jgi:hypothetical protein
MINARESLDLLLSSDKLDGLLAAARTKVATIEKKYQRPDVAKQASELSKHIEQVKEMSGRAIKELREALESKAAQRSEKVAIVRHLLHFGSKIQPAV